MILASVYAVSLVNILAEVVVYGAFLHMAFTLAPTNALVMVGGLATMFGARKLLAYMAQKHMEKLIQKVNASNGEELPGFDWRKDV